MITKKHYLESYDNPIADFVNAPESLQVKLFKENFYHYKHIKNKTKYVRDLYALWNDCRHFLKMKNLTPKQIEDCVYVNSLVLNYIDNPSIELLKLAISLSFDYFKLIKHFKNMNEDDIIKFIEVDCRIMLYIKNPTNQMIQTSFDFLPGCWFLNKICKKHKIEVSDETYINLFKKYKEWRYLKDCKRQFTKEEQISFVNIKSNSIMYIKNQCEEVKEIVFNLSEYSRLFKHIENPTYEMQLKAVKANCDNICFIKSPTEELQLLAIEGDCSLIFDIKNPTRKAIELYFTKIGISLGNFHEMKTSRVVCKNCEEVCGYKFKDGLYDGCPRFIEHIALRK